MIMYGINPKIIEIVILGMQLHQLKTKNKLKDKKRVGRGGKRGTTSGKGQKGQKSRAGHRIRPAIRDFLMRIPKLRGSKNKPTSSKFVSVNLNTLEKKIKEAVIDRQILIKYNIVKGSEKNIIILGSGDLKRALEIKGLKVSQSAKKKIEEAGGKIT